MESMSQPFQLQAHRPVAMGILVPPHHQHRGSHPLHRLPCRHIADITQMPNLIRTRNRL